MREQFRPIATNLTPVNVVGVPGLMLTIIALALAVQFPEARWLIAATVAGGSAIATALIARRRRRLNRDDDDRSQGVLHIYEPVQGSKDSTSSSWPRLGSTLIPIPAAH
jgi:hypothetical protein